LVDSLRSEAQKK